MDESFIASLSESRLISSKASYQRYTAEDVAELAYLYIMGIRILLAEDQSEDWAHDYCRKTAHGDDFSKWRIAGTDLYNLLHACQDDDVHLRDDAAHAKQRHRIKIVPHLLMRWLKSAALSSNIEATTSRVFTTLDRMFRIEQASYRSMRRMVQDWPELSTGEKKATLTKLLAALRHHAAHGELYPHLHKLARLHGLDDADDAHIDEAKDEHKPLINLDTLSLDGIQRHTQTESASAGATGAASVAVSIGSAAGGLGAGFDPNGHERSIYPAPAKTKAKTSVQRRGKAPAAKD